MKIVSIASLKGGVAKTTTTVNMAYILWKHYGKRVLVVDNDKQGNCSKSFQRYNDDDEQTVSRMLSAEQLDVRKIIKHTNYDGIDIITANTGMIKACMELSFNQTVPQQLCFKNALQQIEEEYDFCIIDNAPNVDVAVINSLACADSIVIPVMVDQYALDGLTILLDQIEIVKQNFNNKLKISGCLITAYKRDTNIDVEVEKLQEKRLKVFDTKIKRTEGKIVQSTFTGVPVVELSSRCGASRSYRKFVEEFLKEV